MDPGRGRPARSGRFAGKDLGDEYVFYDSAGDRVHVLNRTARSIYLLCDGTRSEEDIARAIAAEYEVAEETALADARETIGRLLDLEILKPTV